MKILIVGIVIAAGLGLGVFLGIKYDEVVIVITIEDVEDKDTETVSPISSKSIEKHGKTPMITEPHNPYKHPPKMWAEPYNPHKDTSKMWAEPYNPHKYPDKNIAEPYIPIPDLGNSPRDL